MSKIQRLLETKSTQMDFEKVLAAYPWIAERGNRAILSPDSDGLLCGLLMTSLFDWEVAGFYDGKVLVLRDGVSATDANVAFLDIEVFRKDVRSVGHHMLLLNNRHVPPNWGNYANCLQPNNLRGYAGKSDFRLKYPLATIHLLLSILGREGAIELPPTAVQPLLFTDGTYNVLFGYPENVLNWLSYLRAGDAKSPLRSIFMGGDLTVFETMKQMDLFFRRRDLISIPKERGDRLRLSTTDGEPFNLVDNGNGLFAVEEAARGRAVQFLELLSQTTGWKYDPKRWSFSNLRVTKFEKSSFTRNKWTLTNDRFASLMQQNPVSWAMTSGNEIEYTLQGSSKFP